MYTQIRSSGWIAYLKSEAVPLILSLAIAEFFYKFHSFLLECVAFLVTWYVMSAAYNIILSALYGSPRMPR